jgi:hypothetical protein
VVVSVPDAVVAVPDAVVAAPPAAVVAAAAVSFELLLSSLPQATAARLSAPSEVQMANRRVRVSCPMSASPCLSADGSGVSAPWHVFKIALAYESRFDS